MAVEEAIPWSKLGDYGIGIVALVIVYLLVRLFIEMWKMSIESQNKSTDAINRNTSGFTQLSNVLATQSERDRLFQVEALELLKETNKQTKQTHKKVIDIHGKLFGEDDA